MSWLKPRPTKTTRLFSGLRRNFATYTGGIDN